VGNGDAGGGGVGDGDGGNCGCGGAHGGIRGFSPLPDPESSPELGSGGIPGELNVGTDRIATKLICSTVNPTTCESTSGL